MSAALGLLRALNDGLQQLGWGVYQSDHEDANYQYEVNFRYADALTTADRLTFFRMMLGQVAARHGAIATNPVRDIGRVPGARRSVKAVPTEAASKPVANSTTRRLG